ncbi:AI-2E family transporter [Wohlfahrtiimonas chitiniclastica]|uniref:AI-2E family transporter n=1 Tax=Wohlfahrtiimonas chitiniclastica TaxID=400946 RepID=UPI000B989616|nr:AI-2E family transporter [Wohlfahrtiimonas chitiniclastica]OYQ84995.1 hypothetical protein B9T14_00530 [Wohlfahrtiimonas chitiniclastica]OYQ86771.1 hypothetical protein B9T15_04510 [Wohlfahrtiimonas chitiniclastica]
MSLLTNRQIILWLCILFFGWLIFMLRPVLTPFLIAFGLAYIGNPIVMKLQSRLPKISRMWAVTIVFTVITIILLMLLLILIPMLINQVIVFLNRLPAVFSWVQEHILKPYGKELSPEFVKLNFATVQEALSNYGGMIGETLRKVISSLTSSTMMIIGFLTSLFLIPMLTFYFMRDWQLINHQLGTLIPLKVRDRVLNFLTDANEMLGSFMRGQLSVMFALALVYSLGLTLVGLELGLLVGMLAGLISFIPYLGASTGIVVGLTMAWFQTHDYKLLILVGIVFAIGQLLESFVLTPKLVGDKLGMHPVAVIFALMAGGALFGFFGILLALPVCAVLMVGLREAYKAYTHSQFYTGKGASD